MGKKVLGGWTIPRWEICIILAIHVNSVFCFHISTSLTVINTCMFKRWNKEMAQGTFIPSDC